jgi:hypothetical protein
MNDQWVPPAPTTPPSPPSNPFPPANSWNDVAGCLVSANQPSIVSGIVINGVPATISSIYWQVSLNDGSGNFQINQLDGQGNFVATAVQISPSSISFNEPVLLSRDPVDPMEPVTLEYLQANPTGIPEAPMDQGIYARFMGTWYSLPAIIPDAPGISQIMGRFNGTWAVVPIQTDAPSDGNTYGRLNGAWNQALATTGGTITGSLTVNQVLTVQGPNSLVLNAPLNNPRAILAQAAGITRWLLNLGDQTNEGLNNVGANFSLQAYSTTGVSLGTWLSIARADGSTTFNGSGVTINGGLSVNGLLALASPNNLAIYGGSAGQFLETNGAGVLSWQTPPGAGGGIGEAPTDGNAYLRSNAAWASSGTIAGTLNISPPTGTATLNLNSGSSTNTVSITTGVNAALSFNSAQTTTVTMRKGPGFSADIISAMATGGSLWMLSLGDTAPNSGGNAGSNFVVSAFDDGGSNYLTPLSISRATGVVNFSTTPTVAGVPIGGGGIADAPNDGTAYARKSAAWAHLAHTDITDWTATLANYYPTSNPSGYQTAANVTAALAPYALTSSLPPASTVLPIIDGTAAIGVSTAYARADHVHPASAASGGDTVDIAYFGDGSDGAVSITTTVVLTRDMYYSNLAISGAGILQTNGWRVFVSGVLDLSAAGAGAIAPNIPSTVGGNGASPTGGTSGFGRAGTFFQTLNGNVGGGGATAANGSATGGGPNSVLAPGALGGIGGSGGPGGIGTGTGTPGPGSSTAASAIARLRLLLTLPVIPLTTTTAPIYFAGGGGGSGGGGSGATNAVNGGGGGGGGGPAGAIFLWARTILRGAGTAAGVINLSGMNGGNGGPLTGGAGSGGGGGGGGGGFAYLVYRFLTGSTATNAINLSGGNGGNAGAGTALQQGQGGQGGQAGYAVFCNIATDTITASGGAAGSGPTGTGSLVGGLGGVGLVNL